MAAPVWLLTVDLQTKTASFTTGLADAARNARGAFSSIGDGAENMSHRANKGFGSVRASLGLIDNTIRGAHAQAMADLVHMMSQSAIVMAALPIAATVAGFALLAGIVVEVVEKLNQLRLAHEKLTDDMLRFGTTADETYRSLEDKLLTAEQRTDELRNDHMAALQKQLELIDHQSMDELMKSLDAVAKGADSLFKDLGGHWYTFWEGSAAGATHSLTEFEVRYKSMLAAGNEQGASSSLHSKLERELKILKDQQAVAASHGESTDESWAARVELQRMGAGYAEKDIQAQQALVGILQDQVRNEDTINKLKKQDSDNARIQTGQQESQRHAAAARESAQSMLQMGNQAAAAAKATADAALTIHRASLEQQLASDIEFAARSRDVQLAANQADIAALDKSGKDYQNQLRALQDKTLQIQSAYDAKVAELKATESVAAYNRDLDNLRMSEQEKIAATREGDNARLAAIDAAIKTEQEHQLTQTQQYRDLLKERVQVARQIAESDRKDKETAAREAADNAAKMGLLRVQAEQQAMALEDSARHVSRARRLQEAEHIAKEEYAIRMKALQDVMAGLDQSGRNYLSRLKQLQDQEKQLTQEHQNELKAIKDRATEASNQQIVSSYQRMVQSTSRDLTQSIMGHETWSRMLVSLGDQVIGGMLQNAIKSAMLDDFDRERDAARAARKFFLAGAQMPFPANIIMAPTLAAGAFATVMAFAQGGVVPGVAKGDVVPAMLTPGEGVVPGGVMDGLRNIARNGGFQHQGQTIHVHVRPTYNVSTIDGDGMQDVLDKHTDQLQHHFETSLRRMNH